MTSDSTPSKPARRRVTRPAGGPAAGAPAATPVLPDLGITLPTRDEPAKAEPTKTQVTAGRSTGTGSRRVVRSLDDIQLPGGTPAAAPTAEPAAAKAPQAEKPAKSESAPKRRRRAVANIELPVAGEAAAETPAAEKPSVDAASEAPAPARARRSRAKSAPAAAAEVETAAPAAETAQPAEAPQRPARSRRSSRATAAPAAEAAAPAPVAAAAETPQAADQPAEPATVARAQGTSTPRLATTALLFQAPDLTTTRRPRRAQAPAGPPQVKAPEADAAEPATAEATAAPEATVAPAEAPAERKGARKPAIEIELPEPAPARERGRRSGKAAPIRDISEIVLPEAGTKGGSGKPAAKPAVELELPEPAPVVELTGEDAAAAEEVAAIEAELVADGIELVDLGPEDLVEDEDAELDESDATDSADDRPRRRRRRGGRGRRTGTRRPEGDDEESDEQDEDETAADAVEHDDEGEDEVAEDAVDAEGEEGGSRRRRRRRRGSRAERAESGRTPRSSDEVTALKGSTRLEAKRQRRREGRDAGRRRQIITEAEFLARRESVSRSMVVREKNGRTQIAVLEDGVLVEHYVSQQAQVSMVGNVYLGRVQNVLPSMEAAFVDVGRGRNAVLYAGEVNWDAAGLEANQQRKIESALKSGDSVLVQVTKDPIGHKGARLTSQITLAGRYLVLVPGGGMTGISRKLPDVERNRLKKILREIVPESAGVIVRTAAEGASEEELRADVERLQSQWDAIQAKAGKSSTSAPALLQGEPDLAIRVVRDIFNDDFSSLVVQGDGAWDEVSKYVEELAPDLRERVTKWLEPTDVFTVHRVDEQLAKGMDRKVWLPSGGSLVIDRTEAMTVIDVNTGKFTGTGGTLEETVTRNNLEAAEEIVRQLRLRDIGGIIVIDFVDMVLESNRDLVLRRLVECLGRDRTKHQVAEVTSLGLVQMTRKRVGQGLVEAFSETCEHCKGRGFIVHTEPIEKGGNGHAHAPAEAAPAADAGAGESKRARRRRGAAAKAEAAAHPEVPKLPDEKSEAREAVKATLATIAAAAAHAHEHEHEARPETDDREVKEISVD